MENRQELVILYTKYPRPGCSKTRLAPELGVAGAAKFQRWLTGEVISTLGQLQDVRPVEIQVHFAGGSSKLMEEWLGNSHRFYRQCDGDLGVRMATSISSQLGSFSKIVLLGSDCPDINISILGEAFDVLRKNDLVIGPTFDGGYYCIGVTNKIKQEKLHAIFHGIDWSTDSVFTQTIENIDKLNLHVYILPQLHDIDTPDDLRHIGYHSNPE